MLTRKPIVRREVETEGSAISGQIAIQIRGVRSSLKPLTASGSSRHYAMNETKFRVNALLIWIFNYSILKINSCNWKIANIRKYLQ